MPERVVDCRCNDLPKRGGKAQQLLPFAWLLPRALWQWLLACAVFAAPLAAVFAATPTAGADQTLSAAQLEAMVADFLHNQTVGLADRVRVEVTWPADANRLPPCSVAAPEMAPGQRLWGRLTVTLRCFAPQPWQINVPVLVRRYGSYVVTTRTLRLRSEVTAADLTVQDGELTFLPEDLIRDPHEAVGKVARVGIAAGQPLRSAWLETPVVVRNGDTVKVIHQGESFRVETEGRAMNGASAGERVRVRLANGQVLEGVAVRQGVVAITP